MKAKLVGPDCDSGQREFRLERFPVLIGRSPDAGIQPADLEVSDHHCEIDVAGGCLLVRDLGSTAGTYVNGRAIDIALLMPGDRLTVARSDYVADYELSDAARRRSREASPAPPATADTADAVSFLDLVDLLDHQREVFRRRYGREFGPDDPMFPDPPHPEHLEHLLAEEMRRADIDPAVIYAFEQTGLLLTELNLDQYSDDDLRRWQQAVTDYEQGSTQNPQPRFPCGALAMYGPNLETTVMIVASVMATPDAEPIYRRWVGRDVREDPQVLAQIREFFVEHDVRSVLSVKENIGCAHEEGLDYPVGEDCPFCPFWRGRENS